RGLEGVLGVEVVEQRAQRGELDALDLELEQVLALGRLHRHSLRVDVGRLFEVVNDEQRPQHQFEQLEVESLQLGGEVGLVVSTGGAQPDENFVRVDAIFSPRGEVDESSKLRRGGEL